MSPLTGLLDGVMLSAPYPRGLTPLAITFRHSVAEDVNYRHGSKPYSSRKYDVALSVNATVNSTANSTARDE